MFSPESSASIPESPPAIAFDQAIRDRMTELGLDLAGLNRRYCDYLRSQGDLKATPNNRRRTLVAIVEGKADPTLKTVLNLIHSQVLHGEMLLHWVGHHDPIAIPNPEAVASSVRERMKELGYDPNNSSEVYQLTRQYCDIRFGNQWQKVENHISVIRTLIDDTANPKIQNLVAVIQTLRGRVSIRWINKVREKIKSSPLMEALTENVLETKPIFVEFEQRGQIYLIKGSSKLENK